MAHQEDPLGSFSSRGYRRWSFSDRAHAGKALATQLEHYRGARPIVLATRGRAIPVALEVASELEAELDLKASCALMAPGSSQHALGAVTADGVRWLNQQAISQMELSSAWVDCQTRALIHEARRVELQLRRDQAPLDVTGRVVILVDEGLTTGATMRAAAASLRDWAQRLVIAVPVASTAALALVAEVADEVICPLSPVPFAGVGMHYRSAEPLSASQAERALRAFRRQRRRHSESLARRSNMRAD